VRREDVAYRRRLLRPAEQREAVGVPRRVPEVLCAPAARARRSLAPREPSRL